MKAATLLLLILLAQSQQPRLHQLSQLADYVEHIPPTHFNMNSWGSSLNPNNPYYSGCALGHATHLFASQGLRLYLPPPATQQQPKISVQYITPLKQSINLDAAQDFFNLPPPDAALLFGYHPNRSPTQEAHIIRTYVNNYTPHITRHMPTPPPQYNME